MTATNMCSNFGSKWCSPANPESPGLGTLTWNGEEVRTVKHTPIVPTQDGTLLLNLMSSMKRMKIAADEKTEEEN